MKNIIRLFKALGIGLGILILLAVLIFGYRDIPVEDLKEKYAAPPSQFVQLNQMPVHFRDEGNQADSIPLVLIHGTGSSLHTFDAWTNALQNNRRVIRFDLPGFGLTGPEPNADYSQKAYAHFIKQLLDHLKIKKCIIGGNSLGGRISWNFTLEYPEMVKKLILIDASGYSSTSKSTPLAFELAESPLLKNLVTYITPKAMARSSVKNVYADKSKVNAALVDRYFDLTLREGNRMALFDLMATKADTAAYHKISTIQQPTLVLWGDQDLLIPVNNAHRFHEDLPNDTLVILKNVGHVPMEEAPQESLEALKSFLENY